jgi:hypothetical protein
MGDVLHVKTGDSSSCTNLSICMSILTVISNSALVVESVGKILAGRDEVQNLQEVVGLFICLG